MNEVDDFEKEIQTVLKDEQDLVDYAFIGANGVKGNRLLNHDYIDRVVLSVHIETSEENCKL